MVRGYCGEELPCGTPLGTGNRGRIGTGAAAVVCGGLLVGCAVCDGLYDGTDTEGTGSEFSAPV